MLRRVLVVFLVVTMAACSRGDGKHLADPEPGATAPPRTTATTQAAIGTPAPSVEAFSLTSSAFAEGQPIPVRFSCDGDNVSPPLTWHGIPGGTQELALTVIDPDAGDFVHWVVWGLAPSLTGLSDGQVPEGAKQATSQRGTSGWFGPCPPPGGAHDYVFTLHALSHPLDLADGTDGKDAVATVNGASAAQAVLTGTFER